MLTDTKLRNMKPREKMFKVTDRDGLYVAVSPAGSISFRYNYAVNGRQETVTFGRYGVGGITLAEARERLHEAKKLIADGKYEQQGVRAVYNKAEYLEQRRGMLQDWANMIDGWVKRQPA